MTKLNHLRKTISSLVDDVDSDLVYVLTSGGLDSQSIIFSALEVGKQVVIVSFTTQGHESRDFKSAKKIAMKLDLLFLPVIIPTDLETIKRDSYTLGNELECRTKSEYECTHPMIYAYDVISQHADGKAYILSGLGADCFYVLSKKGKIHYSHRPDEFRYMTFNKENYCQRRQHVILEEKYNCVMVTPYLTDDIYNLFEGTTWDECNRPKQKNHVREQYANELIKGCYFNHTNYQLGDSGIAKNFEQLLDSDWNIKNWKSVVGIYNAITNREIEHIDKFL